MFVSGTPSLQGAGPLFRSSVVTDSSLVREAPGNEVDQRVGSSGIIAYIDNESIQSGEPRKDSVKGGICLLFRKTLELKYAEVAKFVRLGVPEQLGVIFDLIEAIPSEILVCQLKEFLDEWFRGEFAIKMRFVFRVVLPFVVTACLQVDVSVLKWCEHFADYAEQFLICCGLGYLRPEGLVLFFPVDSTQLEEGITFVEGLPQFFEICLGVFGYFFFLWLCLKVELARKKQEEAYGCAKILHFGFFVTLSYSAGGTGASLA